MFTEVFYKLSKCVSEFWAECSLSFYLSGVWEWQNSRTLNTCMGIYTKPMKSGSKDLTDGPKDHLSTIVHTKDQHGPRRIILRGLMVEPWSNHIFRSPRRIRCILRGYPSIRTSFNCCPSQTGGWLTWSTYNTNQDIVYIRPNTDKVQTQVHQQTPPWL